MTMLNKKAGLLAGIGAGLLVLAAVYFWSANEPLKRPAGDAPESYLKVLTTAQYRNIVRDLFGSAVVLSGNLPDPIEREEGLLAVGASHSAISSAGFATAEDMARNVARQVISEELRAELIGCEPQSVTDYDDACTRSFIGNVGKHLYRRTLSETEVAGLLQVAQARAEEKQSFYAGIERSLINMLVSPNFLFRSEVFEPDPKHDGHYRLTAWSKASRLSFLLWDSAPDAQLLEVAATGDLHRPSVLEGEVSRMMSSARLVRGVRRFFSDMLALDDFADLSKDPLIYPKFTPAVAKEAPEQLLRTVVDHLLNREGDYRDLFVARHTWLTPALAALMKVPLVQVEAASTPGHWTAHTFDEGDPRAGILAQPAFVALNAHAGRTSPTLRGKALRENLLCQAVPEPPPNVDFSGFQESVHSENSTARQRLQAHAINPTCAGCHKITDPIGLALESFDGIGEYRTRENGVQIDTSGEMDGIPFDDAAELGAVLRDNPGVISCVVNRVFAYGAGKLAESHDRRWLKTVREEFAEQGYRFKHLLRLIATNDEFYRS